MAGHRVVRLWLERTHRLGRTDHRRAELRHPKRDDDQFVADGAQPTPIIDRTAITEDLLQVVGHQVIRHRVVRRHPAIVSEIRRAERPRRRWYRADLKALHQFM